MGKRGGKACHLRSIFLDEAIDLQFFLQFGLILFGSDLSQLGYVKLSTASWTLRLRVESALYTRPTIQMAAASYGEVLHGFLEANWAWIGNILNHARHNGLKVSEAKSMFVSALNRC